LDQIMPELRDLFPERLGDVDVETIYRAANKVEPSLIRVEADQVTYNLHIILRFELELEIFANRIELRDLPEAWNARMRDYLGIQPGGAYPVGSGAAVLMRRRASGK